MAPVFLYVKSIDDEGITRQYPRKGKGARGYQRAKRSMQWSECGRKATYKRPVDRLRLGMAY